MDRSFPAFPNGPGSPIATNGMSLRDYFAAQALSRYSADYCFHRSIDLEEVARRCYMTADAMLEERKK